jgi:hypothetical protein
MFIYQWIFISWTAMEGIVGITVAVVPQALSLLEEESLLV